MQDFAHGRVRKDDLLHLSYGIAVPYGEGSRGDELRGGVADTVYADNGLVAFLHNHLTEPRLAFVLRHETAGESHR